MTYNSDLQSKNARIQALIDRANALPDAGAGGAPEDLSAVLAEQEQLIATLQDTLRGKTAGEGGDDGYDAGYAAGYDAAKANTDALIDGSITEVSSDAVTVKSYTFQSSKLEKADFTSVATIKSCVFRYCSKLNTVILRGGTVCTLEKADSFTSTPIASGTGYIYVHKTLSDGSDGVAAHQTATNWSVYAAQFRAIEDYPEICGG